MQRKSNKKLPHRKYIPSAKAFLLAWDNNTQSFSPTLMFAYWHRSGLLEGWQKTEHIDDWSMKIAMNYPDCVMKDFRKWSVAQTDQENWIKVPWNEFDTWLKRNGFTGKVDADYIKPSKKWMAEKERKRQHKLMCMRKEETAKTRASFFPWPVTKYP